VQSLHLQIFLALKVIALIHLISTNFAAIGATSIQNSGL